MWKRGLILLLVVSTVISMSFIPVHATEETDTTEAEVECTPDEWEAAAEAIYEETPQTNEISKWPQGPNVWGDGAILMDMQSGAVLYAKNSEKKFYPASITKLLTALIALENGKLTDTVTATDSTYDGMDWTYSSLNMQPGEQMPLEEALHGLLLVSANEMGHAIAESSTGGYDDFICKMNEKVQELGGVNSNFVNTNGIQDENHYTCAYDMALIGAAVYQIPEFREIESHIEHDIPATNKSDARVGLVQDNKMMLPENSHYCEYVKAGKTGYTDDSRSTFVAMADNGTLQFVYVDLYNPKALTYDDTQAILDYGFANFKKITLKDQKISKDIESIDSDDAYVVVPNDVEFSDLDMTLTLDEKAGNRTGTVSYTYQDQPVGTADVVVTETYYEDTTGKHPIGVSDTTEKTAKKGFHIPVWLVIILVVVLLLVILTVTLSVIRARKRRIARERKRAQMRRRRLQEESSGGSQHRRRQ